MADTTIPPLGQLSTTRTPIQQIYSQSTSPPTHCQTITNPPILNPIPICDKCMPIKGLFLIITKLSPSTHLMSILHNSTGKMCLLPGNTSRSIQHISNIKSVDLGPMPMPISRKFTSSDKMPILHIKCQYFTNLPIHNQSCPNTDQCKWQMYSYLLEQELYWDPTTGLDGG